MSGLKLTTNIHHFVTREKMSLPHFSRTLGLTNELLVSQMVPRPIEVQSPTLWDETIHSGFDRFETVKTIFSRGVVRIATEIYSGGDNRVIVEIHLHGKGRERQLGFVYMVFNLQSGEINALTIRDTVAEPFPE